MGKRAHGRGKRPKERAGLDVFLRVTFPGGDVVALSPPDVMVLGRSDDCDIVVPESNVSRRHAEIIYKDRGFVLRDLGSTNGTYRNADRAGELELRDGDIIQLGEVAFLWAVLVSSSKGIRPIRDKILVDGTARMENDPSAVSFLWLARLPAIRRELELSKDVTHLVISFPDSEEKQGLGFAYPVTGDGTVTSRKRLEVHLPPGSPARSALSKAVVDTTYSLEDVDAISKGTREGALPYEVRALGF